MKVLIPGHRYELENFVDSRSDLNQTLQFIQKEPRSDGHTHLISDGTTNEEVLKVLIDRIQTLNAIFPCRENSVAITKLDEALMWLEKRTRDRIFRGVEGTHQK